tara:strand:- start:3574 stop:4650 length:1077 start_codon:yes stop_codon:yes gene_type:complete
LELKMVELERLERVQQSGKYPNLLTSTDVENIKAIVESNPSLFAYGWSDKRSTRRDSGATFSKRSDGTNLYGFWFNHPSGTGNHRLWDGHILRNNLFNYSSEEIGYWFSADDLTYPEEEHISLDSVPLFEPSIMNLCSLASEITGRTQVADLKDALDLIKNIDNLEDLDYTINYIIVNKKRQTLEIGLEKNANETRFTPLVEHLTTEGTGARRNCIAVSELIQGDFLSESGDNVTSFTLKYGPGGLPEETTFVISTTHSKLAPVGTSPQDNYKIFQLRSASHRNFVCGTSNICNEYGWIKEVIKNEIDIWEDEDLLENVYGVTKITANESGTVTEIIYGFSGPKGGNQPTFTPPRIKD